MLSVHRMVRFIIFGSSGVGKSKLGNRLLQQNCFAVANFFDAVTSEPSTASAFIGDVRLSITDTVGFNDPNRDSNETLREVATFLQEDENGPINRFILVQNGNERFTRDMADNIRMLLYSFGEENPCVSIVLTHCSELAPEAEQIRNNYRNSLIRCFSQSDLLEKVSNIEIFLIDNNDTNPSPIPRELDPLNPHQPRPISPHLFRPKGYEGEVTRELEKRFIEENIDADFLYGKNVDRWRWKTIPFTGNGVHYTDWVDNVPPTEFSIALEWREERIRSENNVLNEEFIVSEFFKKFRVKPVITGEYNPEITYSNFEEIPGTLQMYEIRSITKSFEERNQTKDDAWEITQCKKEQKVKISYERSENGWIEVSRDIISDWREVDGTLVEFSEYIEYRTRNGDDKTEENGIWFNHSTIKHKQWLEKRLVRIADGNRTCGNWEVIEDSEKVSVSEESSPTFAYWLLLSISASAGMALGV